MLTLSGLKTDFSGYAERHFKTNTGILQLGASQSPPFKNSSLFVSLAIQFFLTIYIIAYYSVCIHTKLGKRTLEKYRSYGTLSKTTYFLSVFCEAVLVQDGPIHHAKKCNT